MASTPIGGNFGITPQHGVNRAHQKHTPAADPHEGNWAPQGDSMNINFTATPATRNDAKPSKSAHTPAETTVAPQTSGPRVSNAPALLSMEEVSGIGFGLSTSDPGALQGINGIHSVIAKGGFETLGGQFIKA